MGGPDQHTPRRVSPAVTAMIAGLVLALVISFVIAAGGGDENGGGDRGDEAEAIDPRRASLTAYEHAIRPIVREGGRVVVEGLRPGIVAVGDGAAPDAQLESMTEAYANELRLLRDQLLEVEPPGFLQPAYELFDEAMQGYVETAELLHRAARARGDDRAELVEQVAPSGESADAAYDAAWEIINDWRRRLGLPVEEA